MTKPRFGRAEFPGSLQKAGGRRAKLFGRLDRARSEQASCVQETFAWAAGHGYCSFLTSTAARVEQTSEPKVLQELLNGPGKPREPPLWRAAKRNQPGAVALLLEMRADAERSSRGTTPLFWAARHGDVASVRRLLELHASPLASTSHARPEAQQQPNAPRHPGGECPLSAVLLPPAAEVSGQRLESLQLMAEALTAEQRSEATARRALLAACSTPGAVPYVAVLLDAGCGVASQAPAQAQVPAAQAPPRVPLAPEADLETPLLAALNRGCLDVAELLFAKDAYFAK